MTVNEGGIIARGTHSVATTVPSETGTRLIWYPEKSAFRAGHTTGAQWDDVNIGEYSIAMGYDTKAKSSYTFIGGGENNRIEFNSDYSTVTGGKNNLIESGHEYSFIGGGHDNKIDSIGNVIGGGHDNSIVNGGWSVIAGGAEHFLKGSWSVICGGINNGTNSTANRALMSFIGGGGSNRFEGSVGQGVISGGYANKLINSNWGAIGGGSSNESSSDYASIGGGFRNEIFLDAGHSVINGGNDNKIKDGANHSVIGGGGWNRIDENAGYSTISGGNENLVDLQAEYSTISGGRRNLVDLEAEYSTIGGGDSNSIAEKVTYAIIGGGHGNKINACGTKSGIVVPGIKSGISLPGGSFGFIGGGFKNEIDSIANVIGGGAFNHIKGLANVIGGGGDNDIQNGAIGSAILAGVGNIVDASHYSTILGGPENIISSHYSLAFGEEVHVETDYTTVFYDDEHPGKLGVNEEKPTSSFQVSGSFAGQVISAPTSGTTVDLSTGTNGEKNFTIFADGVNITEVKLPDPSTCKGRIYVIRNTDNPDDGGPLEVEISADGSGTRIDFDPKKTLRSRPTRKKPTGIIVQSDGGFKWWIISELD